MIFARAILCSFGTAVYNNGMSRKIFKTGHSLAVTVSKKLLEQMGLKLGDSVKMEFDKDKECLIIRPGSKENQLVLNIRSRPRLGSKK